MFDIGWTELLVIGVVALIVVGPEDLPSMFKKLGQFTAKIRRMAREFGRAMEDAADASGVKEAAKDLNSIRNIGSPMNMGKKAMGLDGDLDFDDDDDGPPKAGDPRLSQTPLSEERAADAKKMSEAMAAAATKRHEAEAQAAAEAAKKAESDAT